MLKLLATAAVALLIASGCSEAEEPGDVSASPTAAPTAPTEPTGTAGAGGSSAAPVDTVANDGSIVASLAGESWYLGTIPDAAVAADPSLEPIKIGMLNIENVEGFSYPELRGAAEAAATFVNTELGGVEGHAIEIVPCITSLTPEQSTACAQEMAQEGVVAMVGGIDIMSQGSVPILQQNGIPTLGGIPAQTPEQVSDHHFYFSGGTAGAMAGMLSHAEKNGATSVMIANADLPSFNDTSEDFAGKVAESLGMSVEYVRFPLVNADMLPVMTAAVDADVDALIVNAADTACVPIMEFSKQLELRAQVYLVGACAAENILVAAGENAAGIIFSGEGPADAQDLEGTIYDEVVDRYATGPAEAAGTVGFRGFMNLYAALLEVGYDNLTSENIITYMRSTNEVPSFWGHHYTCDGQRVPGLPALCAPEQTLFMTTGNPDDDIVFLPELFEDTGGWVETDELYAVALG